MSAIDWPSGFPCFQLNGHQYGQENTIQRTTFQSGRVRTRRKLETVPENFGVTVKLDNQQMAMFEAWLFYKVKDIGWMNLPIRTASGQLSTRTVRLKSNDFPKKYIGGASQGDNTAGYWSVQLELETLQQEYMSEADLDALL